MTPTTLRAVVLIPSRYDRRGVMVFRRGLVPNSTAGFIAGLCEDYNRRHPGGTHVAWQIFDEHVQTSVTDEMLQQWRAEAGTTPLLLLVAAVQTNNYPRARDICLMARRAGITVVAGGVHLSCHGPSVDFLMSCGVSVALGEAEPFFDEIIDDATAGRLKPLYRIGEGAGVLSKTSTADIRVPELDHLPFPEIPQSYLRRFVHRQIHVDSSRGCPFLCTFCAVKNAFGRTVRSRDPAALVAWMADQVRRNGVRWFDFTDDNFVRNPRRLEVLEGLARLREGGLSFNLKMMLDIEATCYANENSPRGAATRSFLELCRRAGVRHVYIGVETTSDTSLKEIRKNVNRVRHTEAEERDVALIDRFHAGVTAWRSIGATTACIIMLGLDSDTRESGTKGGEDADAIGFDFASFLWITPLPGADNYAQAAARGSLRHGDFNAYFYEPILRHPSLTSDDLAQMVGEATQAFYSVRRVIARLGRSLLRRRARPAAPLQYLVRQIAPMMGRARRFVVIHQVTGGVLRRGSRHCAPRLVIGDEEARAHYLPGVPPRSSQLPASMLDDTRMESLPILRHHDVAASA